MQRNRRWLRPISRAIIVAAPILLVLALVLALSPLPAAADPQVCGYVTVTVQGDPHSVPYLTYCQPPCTDAISAYHGPDHVFVGTTSVDDYVCIKGIDP